MRRRYFLGSAMAGGALPAAASAAQEPASFRTTQQADVFLDRPQTGKPHAGKVLAAIQPHCDDIPIFAGGTVLKLIDEGYRGFLIRTSNDEMAGSGATVGEVVLNNERDTLEVTRRLGLEKLYTLGCRNHMMDGSSKLELRARLIFLFRLLKVDTVLCYDPWGHYEENPDHYVTAQSVEAACWMSGGRWDYPEHFEAGLAPQSIKEKYYFSRGPQLVNRVVDISPYMDRKVDVNLANVTQGPAGENGSRLRRSLAQQGRKLPLLGDDDDTANRAYIKDLVFHDDAELGQQYGVAYAEPFHYIGPTEEYATRYIRENTVAL
ncbi:MAG: PIG-L family deacetylase [Bryobacterales bacterium]|nr:PIG-L family deacetylase [Bryobacterales bacterium]